MAYKFNEIKLEKGMYSQAGKSFEQTLETLDPDENYKGTAYEGLDAYQRQLKRFNIKVRGVGSDAVEKFFSTSESAVLFPEYVSRAVRAGMEEGSVLPSITATVTKCEGMDYRSIYSDADADDKSMRYVSEGGAIPQTEIKASDNLVKLRKRGRMLVASYEATTGKKRRSEKHMMRRITFLREPLRKRQKPKKVWESSVRQWWMWAWRVRRCWEIWPLGDLFQGPQL